MNPLKIYRNKYNLTANKIVESLKSQDISCDISYIYHIESGRSKPSYKIAKALSLISNGEIGILELLESTHNSAA